MIRVSLSAMTTTRARPAVSASLPTVIDGYDFASEAQRAAAMLPDAVVLGRRLNRATAKVTFTGEVPADDEARREHRAAIFQTTTDPDSPVLELGWPVSGHYVMDSRGVHFDLYLGVGQKLLDENHPSVKRAAQALMDAGLLLRREINTDDFLRVAAHAPGIHTPQDLARRIDAMAAAAYPGSGAWRTFFTNSGTESVEACLKLAYEVRYKRFVEAHGLAVLAKVMAELGIGEYEPLRADASRPDPVYDDYPFFVVGCHDAFHGRTLGALALTASKKAQKLGFPRSRWVRHIAVNRPGALGALIDATPLATHLATPGSLRRTIEAGRIPADLFAGFMVEAVQGEGGYVPVTREFAQDCSAVCRAHGALFMFDEVQTFGRTGTMLFGEQLGVAPDAMSLAKGLFTGAMVARADVDRHLHVGWHSNTWGGGKMFDNQIAAAVLTAMTEERSDVFLGRSYTENLTLKGKLAEAGLAELAARHPTLVVGSMVRGGMTRISVRRRADVIRAAWKRGLKLLVCGRPGEVAAIRMLYLADVLGREIGEAMDLLDLALADVERSAG